MRIMDARPQSSRLVAPFLATTSDKFKARQYGTHRRFGTDEGHFKDQTHVLAIGNKT